VKAFFAIILGFIGLLMSTCGGLFTFAAFSAPGVLVISLPSLVVGGFLIWGARTLWNSRSPDSEAPAQPPQQ